MRNRLAAAAILATLGVSLFYAAQAARDWVRASRAPPSDFDLFVREAQERIPPEARVLVRAGSPLETRTHRLANVLSTRLHPRIVVYDGPADWTIEIPSGEFDRSRTVLRAVSP